jgi:hypothetical protein
LLGFVLFCIVVNAIAGKGEATSCYKWFYNHLDGYVEDKGKYWERIQSHEQTDRLYTKERKKLLLNTQFVFSHESMKNKTVPAEKL